MLHTLQSAEGRGEMLAAQQVSDASTMAIPVADNPAVTLSLPSTFTV